MYIESLKKMIGLHDGELSPSESVEKGKSDMDFMKGLGSKSRLAKTRALTEQSFI